MPNYPISLDDTLSLPPVSGVDENSTAINALNDVVISIEQELGITPKGIYSDTRTRLDILESRVNNPSVTSVLPDGYANSPIYLVNNFYPLTVTISAGDGYPSENRLDGSIYLRRDGDPSEGIYTRKDGSWNLVTGGGGGGGSFSAGGDLTGTSFSQTVAKLRGKSLAPAMSSIGSAQDGYVITWVNGSAEYQVKPVSSPITWADDLVGSTNTSQKVKTITGDVGATTTIFLGDASNNEIDIKPKDTTNVAGGGQLFIKGQSPTGDGPGGDTFVKGGDAFDTLNFVGGNAGIVGGLGLTKGSAIIDGGAVYIDSNVDGIFITGNLGGPITLASAGAGTINLNTPALKANVLAGFGDGYIKVNNSGQFSWSAGPGSEFPAFTNAYELLRINGSNNGVEWSSPVIIFDLGAASSNIRSNRSVNQSPINNALDGIVNLSSDTSGVSLGITSNYSCAVGGDRNAISGDYSFVGGGYNNNIISTYSAISGGSTNYVGSDYGFIGSGLQNTINSGLTRSSIISGSNHTINGNYGLIGMGDLNAINGDNNTIISGQTNQINNVSGSPNYSTIGGGNTNVIDGLGDYNTITNGNLNNIHKSNYSIIANGQSNIIGSGSSTSDNSTISGGASNSIGTFSGGDSGRGTIGGGFNNKIGSLVGEGFGPSATISGGQYNIISNGFAGVISGGGTNSIKSPVNLGTSYGTISGGNNNNILDADSSIIAGGVSNNINGNDGYDGFAVGVFVAGRFNTANPNPVGSRKNVQDSCLIGFGNSTSAQYSFAFGRNCTITEDGYYGFAIGRSSKSNRPGQLSYGSLSNFFGNPGNAQSGIMHIGAIASGAITATLQDKVSTSGAMEFTLENQKAYKIRINILANRTDAAGRACYERTLLAHQSGGVAVIDDNTLVQDVPNGNAWTYSIAATGNIIRITFTGTAGQTTNVMATIQWSELIGF